MEWNSMNWKHAAKIKQCRLESQLKEEEKKVKKVKQIVWQPNSQNYVTARRNYTKQHTILSKEEW